MGLMTCLLIDFGIPQESLQAFHYDVSAREWGVVDSRSSSTQKSCTEVGGIELGEIFAGSSAALQDENTKKPYHDGDIIVINDLRRGSHADALTVEKLSNIRLAAQPTSQSNWQKFNNVNIPRREEAQLKIHVDNFDDEDEVLEKKSKRSLRTSA